MGDDPPITGAFLRSIMPSSTAYVDSQSANPLNVKKMYNSPCELMEKKELMEGNSVTEETVQKARRK